MSLALGLAATFFGGLRDGYRTAKGLSLSWDTAIFYADRLFWLGLVTAGFVVLDFARRATDETQQARCVGGGMSWLVCICVLCMVILAVSFGMVLMADADAVRALVTIEMIRGYSAVVVVAVVLPLIYALVIDSR